MLQEAGLIDGERRGSWVYQARDANLRQLAALLNIPELTAATTGGNHMPGASAHTKPVKALNANWVAATGDQADKFQLQIITDDDERHTITPSPDSVPGLLSLVRPDVILLWDPDNRTLIAANIVGTTLTRTPTGITRADQTVTRTDTRN